MLRSLTRKAALRVKPLRRLYDHALQQGELARVRGESVHQLELTVEQQGRELKKQKEEAAKTKGRLDAVGKRADEVERLLESLELDLYVTRSAHHRGQLKNEQLRSVVQQYREETEELRGLLEIERRKVRELEAARAAHSGADLHSSLELIHAKLSARLTKLAGEVATVQQMIGPTQSDADATTRALYLDLIEKSLTGEIAQDSPVSPWSKSYDPEVRLIGRDWPSAAQTMIGSARMRNLRVLAERALRDNIPGDFIEAGVWRGGACIYMRAILRAHNVRDRSVWVADSFAGLPPPDPTSYPADEGDVHHQYEALVVSLEEVRKNFERYGLLDSQVQFLEGWFEDTLPAAPISRLAILRLDGDMYSSTIQTLDALYSKVSTGGYVIVDDYILPGCKKAVDDFRKRHEILEELEEIDGAGVFWRKNK